jgi:histidyl-tRNA synthetase
MPNTPSIMGLHFRYRLWIAEMNSHINIIRIFDDYIAELSSKKNVPAVKEGIDQFKKEFVSFRRQIDDLRHEMHLSKMALAADSKQSSKARSKSNPKLNHRELGKRYSEYRKKFETIKKEFGRFEAKWLK